MKKKIGKKLKLHRETIRQLSSREGQQAQGGATRFCTNTVLCETNFICPSAEPSLCNEPICP